MATVRRADADDRAKRFPASRTHYTSAAFSDPASHDREACASCVSWRERFGVWPGMYDDDAPAKRAAERARIQRWRAERGDW